MKAKSLLMTAFLLASSSAVAEPAFNRNSWTSWQGKWGGDFWTPGNFGTSQLMTCVGTDGSDGSPEFWASGMGDDAARNAYQQTLDWVNVANRDPAYTEVYCGY